jgi:hypothetical protein
MTSVFTIAMTMDRYGQGAPEANSRFGRSIVERGNGAVRSAFDCDLTVAGCKSSRTGAEGGFELRDHIHNT